MSQWEIRQGDALEQLRLLEAGSVQMVCTSPPFWGLRDYGTATWSGGDSHCTHAGRPKPRQDTCGETGANHGRFKESRGTQPGKSAYSIPVRDVCGCGARRLDAQLGLERTPEEYVSRLVKVFREVRRVLVGDGTLWLNLGDCYATGAGKVGAHPGGGEQGARWVGEASRHRDSRRRDPSKTRATRDGTHAGKHTAMAAMGPMTQPNRMPIPGLKPKDLVGIPWRVAFALQGDGWWLRSDIIWAKPNPMPESVTDRPTKAHEYLFLLAKSERYFYNHLAIAEPVVPATLRDRVDSGRFAPDKGFPGTRDHGNGRRGDQPYRNRRTVWTIATQPFADAHFAVMPEALVEPCVLAGSKPGDLVLDPFAGAGTVGVVALRHGRRFLGVELNADYCALARRRIAGPLFAAGAS